MLGLFAIGGASIGGTARTAGRPHSPIAVSEARTFAILSSSAASTALSESRVFVVYSYPAADERLSSARGIVVAKAAGPAQISEARVIAVVKGRVADPRVRAWTFTLDGHDFYVLRLGDKATLVYDVSTKQWAQWDTPRNGAWRPNIGTTWTGAHALAAKYGSNIVAGDDTFGLLWFLDPTQAYDDEPLGTRQLPFTRIVTGQVLAASRQQLPCYAVFVSGDNYGLIARDFTPAIVLETSDDQGRTFTMHDTLTVTIDQNDQPDTWYSLGQFGSPGRIFRLTDNGVFQRIDALDMNDDAG